MPWHEDLFLSWKIKSKNSYETPIKNAVICMDQKESANSSLLFGCTCRLFPNSLLSWAKKLGLLSTAFQFGDVSVFLGSEWKKTKYQCIQDLSNETTRVKNEIREFNALFWWTYFTAYYGLAVNSTSFYLYNIYCGSSLYSEEWARNIYFQEGKQFLRDPAAQWEDLFSGELFGSWDCLPCIFFL